MQHNLEYGFIRNLFGGSILAFVVSVVSILLYDIHSRQFIVSAVLGVVYLIIILFGGYLLKRYSNAYAQTIAKSN